MQNFKGMDGFTGKNYEFGIDAVDLEDKMIKFTLSTGRGRAECLGEHINDDNTVDRTDSNLRINCIRDIHGLFTEGEAPSLSVIYDALDSILAEMKNIDDDE